MFTKFDPPLRAGDYKSSSSRPSKPSRRPRVDHAVPLTVNQTINPAAIVDPTLLGPGVAGSSSRNTGAQSGANVEPITPQLYVAASPQNLPGTQVKAETVEICPYLISPLTAATLSPPTWTIQGPPYPQPTSTSPSIKPTPKRPKTNRKARNGYKRVTASDEDDPEGELKRQQFLERNRDAARISRQKKKRRGEVLADQARSLEDENVALNESVLALRDEIHALKCECLRYADCNCQTIRNYMSRDLVGLDASRELPGETYAAVGNYYPDQGSWLGGHVFARELPEMGTKRRRDEG